MTDRSTILRYLKIKGLAEGGSRGERANAQRIQARMEAENPGLREAAARYEAGQKAPDPNVSAFTGGGNWENIFSWMQQAASVAYDFAQQAANAQYGTWLGERVTGSIRATRTGNWVIGLRMDNETYWAARQLNDIQKEAFRAALHVELQEQLDRMLGDR